ncbi:peptidase M23 [Micromonospora matsumotoense]|uniref:peptidase M23 n=1 Tax=Micromonospora matsumotoense TaxID=121616 RepID=UPI0033CF7BB4
MRDDDTIDDQGAPRGMTSRSDDTPSSVQVGVLGEPRTRRSLRTRLGGLVNLRRRPVRTRVALAAGVLCCLGATAVAGAQALPEEPTADRAGAEAALAERSRQAASRAEIRTPVTIVPGTPTASPTVASPTAAAPTPTATRTTKPKPRPKPTPKPKPKRIVPVAGLDQAQMDNAKEIVKAGRAMGVPRRALVIAVATAMQESNLYNYASGVLPESQNYPHQAIGWDHDSVGLFQQRPSSGWGEVGQLMDPAFATRAFLNALLEIPGWEDLPLTVAAQAVQISAYPDLYAQHEWRATEVVAAVLV